MEGDSRRRSGEEKGGGEEGAEEYEKEKKKEYSMAQVPTAVYPKDTETDSKSYHHPMFTA